MKMTSTGLVTDIVINDHDLTNSTILMFQMTRNVYCWQHSIVVRTLVSVSKLSLSCARLLAGWVTTLLLSRLLSVSQHGQLSHLSLRGR